MTVGPAVGTAAGRPLPVTSSLTEPFWAAARVHRLVRPLCHACGRSFFTPQVVCTHCLSADWAYAESPGLGTVYSATRVHRPPFPGMAVPFGLAIVDLDEGWSLLTNVDRDGPEPVAIGARVRVAWLELDAQSTLPVFVPDQGAAR